MNRTFTHSTQHSALSTQHSALSTQQFRVIRFVTKVPRARSRAANFISALFSIFLGSFALPVSAQDAPASGVSAVSALATPASGVAAVLPTDEYDWKGDRVQLLTDVQKIKGPEGSTDYFAPDGAVFIVSGDDKDTHRIAGKFVNVERCRDVGCNANVIQVDPIKGLPFLSKVFAWLGVKDITEETARAVPANMHAVDSHGLYELDKAAVEKMPHNRYGWTFGGLIVPFKYQLSDKSFSGSTSIGPYVGYRFQGNSGSYTPVVSAGWVSNIPVTTGTGNETTSASGFSWSAGVIFSVDKGGGIQFGVLAGQDRVGSSATNAYKYEGETWLSMAIGYKVF